MVCGGVCVGGVRGGGGVGVLVHSDEGQQEFHGVREVVRLVGGDLLACCVC